MKLGYTLRKAAKGHGDRVEFDLLQRGITGLWNVVKVV
jgi:hypothetical protein